MKERKDEGKEKEWERKRRKQKEGWENNVGELEKKVVGSLVTTSSSNQEQFEPIDQKQETSV